MARSLFVALLRGINVGGKSLPMARLREVLGGAGLKNVRTYVQSGNVVFEAAGKAEALEQKIEKCIQEDFKLDVRVRVLSAPDFERARKSNPFLKRKGIDETKLHATFLFDQPSKESLEKISQLDAGRDEWAHVGDRIYVYCPDGYGRSKLNGPVLERMLKFPTTTRNWNTMTQLCEMIHSPE